MLLIKAARDPLRILCARELQTSIRDSVHALLKRQIVALNLQNAYDVQQSAIYGANGSEFIFKGLRHDIEQIKSTEDVDICWVEEAQSVSERSWEVLIPTIRKHGSEIWVSFNPDQPTDPTYKRFVKDPPPGCVSVEINWKDNNWFSQESEDDKNHAYATDPEMAEHVWGGKTKTRSKAAVLHGKWVVEPFEPAADWYGPYQGADWGFSSDPTVMVRSWITGEPKSLERELWIEKEVYGIGVDNDFLPELFDRIPGSRNYVTRADNARPEQISHMRRHGFPKFTAAPKWKGSVEDGISHLRGYKRIVIHPSCVHAIDEAKAWSWKTDRLTGDVLPVLVDGNDHVVDSIRYSLSPIIRQRAMHDSGLRTPVGAEETSEHWSREV
jgi:phage terminase large subunit